MHVVRGASSYKFLCSNEKVASSGLNIQRLNLENTYDLPWRLPTTLTYFQALADSIDRAVFRNNLKQNPTACRCTVRTAAGSTIVHNHFDSKHKQ